MASLSLHVQKNKIV
nr:photosystem I subunit VIII [Nigella sativa]QXJ41214.1 photosystem I subunit VIII [Hydrangea febrifuga]WNI02776.1 photosystem I subunit VIII [Nigella sativa]